MIFEEEMEKLEWKYAELAIKPGWIEYIRFAVSQKQKESKLFAGMGERVKLKIERLKDEQANSDQNIKRSPEWEQYT